MRVSIEYKLATGFFVAILLLLLFAISTNRNMSTIVDINQKQRSSHQITNSIDGIRSAVFEIESSSRGYALTNNPLFLQQYGKSVEKINIGWSSLVNFLQNDSFFKARKSSIENLIEQRILFSDSVISIKKISGVIGAAEFISTERGIKLTNAIGKALDVLENHRYEVSDLDNELEEVTAKSTIGMFSIIVLLVAIILFLVYVLFKKDLTLRRNSRKQFKELNKNLEKNIENRVKEYINKEQELIESKSKMNAVIENSIDAIWSIDTELRLIGYNKLYKSITEKLMNIDVHIGMKVWEYLDDEFQLVWKGFYERALSGERFSKELTEFYDGKDHTHDISFNPIIVNDKITGVAIFAHDITLKKKNELKLIESSARMNAVLENSSDSIWSIDKDFKLISFNNSFFESTKLFYDFEPHIGMPILDQMNAEAREIWFQLYNRALNGEHFSEETIDNSIGLELFFDTSFNPIIVNEQITGVAIFARDISSRKNVERQLEYKVKELNTFMYKATHDLRSPLVSLMGLVQLAKDQKVDKEISEYFDMIDLSVHKMDNLLVDLVKIVNVSQGKLLIEEINFNEMIDDLLVSLSHYTDFSEIVFRRQINTDVVFKSDKRLLHSVIQNLIDNAMKYKRGPSSTEPMIIITINTSDKQAQIGITDNGMGMPEKIQDRVFEMFYRGTTASHGTGLGLYIVKTTVEKMGGKIMLSSIEGKGTSMNVIIPNNY